MRTRQVIHGSLRWLAPDDGGLRVPFPSDHWARPAWIEPGDIQHVATLIISGIVPGQPVSPDVSAYWGMWDRITDEEWAVVPGDVLAVTEGPRAVAYLTVLSVEEVRPDE